MKNKKVTLIRRAFRKFAPLGLSALLFGIGLGFGLNWSGYAHAATSYDHLRIFAEVLSMIQNYYVEEKSPKELSEGAIKGLLSTLDPHSMYMDREMFKSRQEETAGKFGGIGIEITIRDSLLTIVSPIEDTPAADKGLKAGDKIIRIDGTPTKDMTLMNAVKKMRGKVGTDVTITIQREGTDKAFDVTITRGIIKIRSVRYGMVDDEVAYLRISSFNQSTTKETKAGLEKMMKKKFKGLVLDLRNNPGGLLDQAVGVSRLFLDKGKTIVSTRGRIGEQNIRRSTIEKGEFSDFPITVLINAGSASASEIVAGAFQDLKRAVIVGTTSFGKGSVQTIRQLTDGSGLSLTTARYYTPAGRMIHGTGIKPDFEVKFIPPEGIDKDAPAPLREKQLMEQFNGNHGKVKGKAKKEKAVKQKKKTSANIKRKLFDLERDNQLRRAVELIKTWELFNDFTARKEN
ncbi:MAG: S41 family peptidase [Nitrospinota bacterium]